MATYQDASAVLGMEKENGLAVGANARGGLRGAHVYGAGDA